MLPFLGDFRREVVDAESAMELLGLGFPWWMSSSGVCDK
jgi:hypothetical protein